MCQNNNNTKSRKGKHLEYIERQSIEKFNTQFYNYMSDEDEIFSFQDVVTVANIAYENNSKYNLSLSEFDKNDIGKNNYVQVLTDCIVDDGNNTRKINLENYVGDNGKLIELLNNNLISKDTAKDNLAFLTAFLFDNSSQ